MGCSGETSLGGATSAGIGGWGWGKQINTEPGEGVGSDKGDGCTTLPGKEASVLEEPLSWDRRTRGEPSRGKPCRPIRILNLILRTMELTEGF